MAATVGTTTLLSLDSSGERRATLSARGQCQSICPFVLLGGVRRHVPAGARIRVHQIWPIQRREDAMAATYTAPEWAAQQRQLGQLARYTIEMGGTIALFETAMRIPPWEALRPLTAEEVAGAGLDNVDDAFDRTAIESAASMAGPGPGSGPAPAFPGAAATDNLKASSWEIVDQAGVAVLTRKYPLTLQGEAIGQFEISFACDGEKTYKVSYSETRRISETTAVRLGGVGIAVGKQGVPLQVGSSLRNARDARLESTASGTVSVEFITDWFRDGGQPLVVATSDSRKVKTNTTIGNAGLSDSFDRFTARCKD
jgi:hypothetical protein